MKKYPKYKDSGIEWIGKIPAHWQVSSIKHLAKIQNGSTPSSSNEEYWNGEINWVTTDDLGKLLNKYIDKTKRTITREGYESCGTTIAPIGSVVISTRAPIGHIGILNIEACSNQGCKTIIPQNVDTLFCFYSLLISKDILESLGQGSTFKELPTSTLKDFKISIPDITEQVKIANYLDRKTSEIDTLITNKEKLIELLKEERTAIINHAVTKGINPKVKLKPSGVEWIGEVPEHWEVIPLKYLGKIVSGNSFKSEDFIEKGDCRVMKISNIQTMRIDWTDESFLPNHFYEQFPNFQIKKGDLVFALTRPIISTGIKASIVDCDDRILLNQRNAVLKPSKLLNVMWMYFIIFNARFIDFFDMLIDKTGQQPNISSLDIANIPIPIPSQIEQSEITKYLEIKTSEIDTIISKTEKEIELLNEYKTALISEVVTGKVDVREEVFV